jgi:hypothetical protein
MIYLAILLVLCGLLIVITALSIETGIGIPAGNQKYDRKNKSDDYYPGDFASEEVEIIFPGDRLEEVNERIYQDNDFISFEDDHLDVYRPGHSFSDDEFEASESDYADKQRNHQTDFSERRKIDSSGRPSVIEKRDNYSLDRNENTLLRRSVNEKDDGEVMAVMFDDRSNIIDYESGVGAIDSTCSKYKSIKRIGKGRIESDYDGVNFYIDEKLYRFDFHKVYDIWSGSNYIALPLKGNSTVKLFIIENSAGFPDKVEANFKEYEKGL